MEKGRLGRERDVLWREGGLMEKGRFGRESDVW